MARAFKNLVTAELGELSNEELKLRAQERQRQRGEYPHNVRVQQIVIDDLSAIAKEAQQRGLFLS